MNKQREAFEKWLDKNPLVLSDATLQDELYWTHGYGQFRKKELNDYTFTAWQAAIASQKVIINTLNDAITEDKILAEINAKLQAEIDRLKAQLAERDKQNE
jgi:uncharacterized coiled-coil protein SlyX